jgi:hypothetical protein
MTSNTYYPQSIDWTSEGKGDTLKTRGTGPDHRHILSNMHSLRLSSSYNDPRMSSLAPVGRDSIHRMYSDNVRRRVSDTWQPQ